MREHILTIMPADHGGFVVWSDTFADRGGFRPLLFAGSLPDCLEFMRTRLAAVPATTAEDEARRAA